MDSLFALNGRATFPIELAVGLGILSLLPFLVIVSTAFLRIVIVFSLLRSAIGASALPPNAAITGLALALTCAVMAPTADRISREAWQPYAAGKLDAAHMVARAENPLRDFMLRQTRTRDLLMFRRIAHRPPTETATQTPLLVVAPAFVVNEMRNGFAIGLALYLPFVAIDLAVASILSGLGMMMLSPSVISLPCKVLLFASIDGWALVSEGLVSSFR